MQGMTRNPLASPSLMGLNAGANFAIVFRSSCDGIVGLPQARAWLKVQSSERMRPRAPAAAGAAPPDGWVVLPVDEYRERD